MTHKVFAIAWREFSSTVLTKAFLIGAFAIPVLAALAIPLIVKLTDQAKAPELSGGVAVVDRSGAVYPGIERRLGAEGIAALIAETSTQAQRAIAEQLGGQADALPEQVRGQLDTPAVREAIARAFGPPPSLDVEALPPEADVDAQRERLRPSARDDSLVALVVIAPDAVERPDGEGPFGGYELFVRAKTDDRHIDLIRRGLRAAVLEARYAAAGVDAEQVEALTTVVASRTQEITDTGEARTATSALNMMLPFAFMLLLIISVMVGGQYLLTTTIEEKSSRVVEVLLSAVSPMQLMTGKIIGQMAVGVVMLAIYAGLGIAALVAFSLADLISAEKLAFLAVYFVLAYFIFASFMAAIGAAVNELREAQSLQTPVMLVVMLPYFFWMPISRDPNSTLSFVLSMVPPVSPFAMVVRIASTEPPPLWQIGLSIVITAAFALGCVWFAAKVFRVGLLMFGKPPNFRTLLRWVRMA
jgi:ABC-2 type transport system permease protein